MSARIQISLYVVEDRDGKATQNGLAQGSGKKRVNRENKGNAQVYYYLFQ